MTKLKFFQELINSLFVKQKNDKPFSFFLDKKKQLTTKEYLHNVASAKGEVSALNHAELLISHCEQLNDKELMNFFELLRKNYELAFISHTDEKNNKTVISFAQIVSFLNKGALMTTLQDIPNGSEVRVSAKKCHTMSKEIKEVIRDFRDISSKKKDIKLDLIGFEKFFDEEKD